MAEGFLTKKQSPSHVAPQCDFRSIHAKNAWVTTRGRFSAGYNMSGNEAQFHEALSKIGGDIQTRQYTGLPFPQLKQIPRGSPIESELHLVTLFYHNSCLGRQTSCI